MGIAPAINRHSTRTLAGAAALEWNSDRHPEQAERPFSSMMRTSPQSTTLPMLSDRSTPTPGAMIVTGEVVSVAP